MNEHSPGSADRKFALIAPFVVGVAAIVVLVLVLVRSPPDSPDETKPATPVATEAAPPAPEASASAAPPPTAVATTPATRRDILTAAAEAADGFAAGKTDGARGLVGRPFSLGLAFGCGGPSADPGAAQAFYQLDPAASAVKLVARPASWTNLNWLRNDAGGAAPEVVEGFWIPRPWVTSEACPARRAIAPPATPTAVEGATLGLAIHRAADGSRLGRREGRAYEHVVKLAAGEVAPASGFRLRLEGRITGFADGSAIRCWNESADHRPICVYAVTLDRVAFEAADGRRLADWTQ